MTRHCRLTVVVSLSLFATVAAWSQQARAEQMQDMMEQAQRMQDCINRLDPAALDVLEAGGAAVDKEIKALCAAGKRDRAAERSAAYGRELAASPEMKALGECGELARQMLPQATKAAARGKADAAAGHVCDNP